MAVAALTLAILIIWPRLRLRVPGPFVALIVATVVVQLGGLDVETIGSRYGAIPSSLPAPRLPVFDLAMIRALIGPAFAIALLAGIEALLSAVVADAMIGGRHRSNMELVAQGVANVVTPLFGGIPATGAIARTATNVRNGGRTPVAGIVHALTLLIITLFFGRWPHHPVRRAGRHPRHRRLAHERVARVPRRVHERRAATCWCCLPRSRSRSPSISSSPSRSVWSWPPSSSCAACPR
jgi:MFS superfamily sulfate permease-like transporter